MQGCLALKIGLRTASSYELHGLQWLQLLVGHDDRADVGCESLHFAGWGLHPYMNTLSSRSCNNSGEKKICVDSESALCSAPDLKMASASMALHSLKDMVD